MVLPASVGPVHDPSPDPGPRRPVRLDQHVDLGSWARFTPSLEQFLSRFNQLDDGVMVLLTAPAPVVNSASDTGARGLLGLLRPGPPPSPEPPGVVIEAGAQRARVWVPVRDAQGRALLDTASSDLLQALGWSRDRDVLTRHLPDAAQASQAATHVLVEVLRVPHPADLDHLVSL